MKSAHPKVLQPLAGQPLLAHVLATAKALAPASIGVVYGHGGDAVREAFASERVNWALQVEQKGTGHAVAQAMPGIPATHRVLVLYGDVPLVRAETLQDLVDRCVDSMTILTVHLPAPKGYGRIVRHADQVARIVEERDATAEERRITEVNTGILCAPAGALGNWLAGLRPENVQREYYLTDVIAAARAANYKVAAVMAGSAEEVLGVNDRIDLARAERSYRSNRARALLETGVTLADPERIDVRGTVAVGQDVFIDTNVILEGTVILGDNVHVGTGCILKNVSLGANSVIAPYSVLDGVHAGTACRIGPFARLRPQTCLADEVHIGNFVEVKNSALGEGSKAGHLSYLGDSSLGARVNIGAGVVTANYDGAHKWPTTLEDDVFVGSGSMLVAPVTVHAGATVGAGTTVRHDVQRQALLVSRPAQEVRNDWRRPAKPRR